MLCGVYVLKWSYGQILQSSLWSFAAPSGLCLVTMLPLINALPAWSVSFAGWPSLGRFVVMPYSLHVLILDLMLCGMFKVFFITQPWSVLLQNFVPDLFGELLGVQVYIYWDHVTYHVTLRLHTGGLYLTNYVTSFASYQRGWIHMHAPLFCFEFF